MTVQKSDTRVPRPYCLRCYLALERRKDARQVCPRCDYVNVRVDQRIYWTQEVWLCRLEQIAKIGIVLLIAWITWQMLFARQAGTGRGHGFAVGFPILLGVVLWDTAGKITRQLPYFRATIVWAVILAFVGVLAAMSGTFGKNIAPLPRLLALTFGYALIGLAIARPFFGRAYGRWQVRRILARTRE
jgi:hypothetical protein